jgi:hypothetical protein
MNLELQKAYHKSVFDGDNPEEAEVEINCASFILEKKKEKCK